MLILASNSPRRKQLITAAGWAFRVLPSQIDERPLPKESPGDYVLRLAREKAWTSFLQLSEAERTGNLVLAADTAVVDNEAILGKPATSAEAETMLRLLRGRTHQVFTALALFDTETLKWYQDLCVTQVTLRAYTDNEIIDYIASGDPFDKAGGYAIQHSAFRPVAKLQGCAANVMGLPVCHLNRLMEKCGQPATNQPWQACRATLATECLIYD